MTPAEQGELRDEFARVERLDLYPDEPLARHTRFGIGGPADLLVVAHDAATFIQAAEIARGSGRPWVVIGGGTNLVVFDAGFHGIVLKLAANRIEAVGANRLQVDSGVLLQDLVDWTTSRGLKGLETMTGIPGWVGAAVYGNAGAYGHSIAECILAVSFFDGERERIFDQAQCEFHYRESVFKQHKAWIILSCEMQFGVEDPEALQKIADEILRVRNEKYPPTMRCAGSIFKNFLFAELPGDVQAVVPSRVVREGKVPSAWFLEQVGAKGMRVGDIQVAPYHANLIYNDGAGTARDLVTVIRELQRRIRDRFGIPLTEEVQYVGAFDEQVGT